MADINSVKELLDIIMRSSNSNILYRQNILFYRGEPKDYQEQKLSPSIFRPPYQTHEKDFFNDAITNFPKDFESLPILSKISKMQHSTYPTRLLDFTHNPLIALYFCCSDKSNHLGQFYIAQCISTSVDRSLLSNNKATVLALEKVDNIKEQLSTTPENYLLQRIDQLLQQMIVEVQSIIDSDDKDNEILDDEDITIELDESEEQDYEEFDSEVSIQNEVFNFLNNEKYKHYIKEMIIVAVGNITPEVISSEFFQLQLLGFWSQVFHQIKESQSDDLIKITIEITQEMFNQCAKEVFQEVKDLFEFTKQKYVEFDDDRVFLLSLLTKLDYDGQKQLFDFISWCINNNMNTLNKAIIDNLSQSNQREGIKQFQILINEAIKERSTFLNYSINAVDLLENYFVSPIIHNDRQKSQKGLFCIFGLGSQFHTARNKDYSIKSMSYSVGNKMNILKELQLLGIDESTIFGDIEHRANFAKYSICQ